MIVDWGCGVAFIGEKTCPKWQVFLVLLAALISLSLLSCRNDPGSPEAQLRARISRGNRR
jgi:hypothetical protein